MNPSSSAAASSKAAQGIALRVIAQALEQHLNATPEHNVHWAAVVGESGIDASPTRTWTKELADSLLMVSVAQGFSEGTLLYVHAQPDRYQTDKLVTLIRVKLLCGWRQAFLAARDAWEFLNSERFDSLVLNPES